jgi:hypothetical protein
LSARIAARLAVRPGSQLIEPVERFGSIRSEDRHEGGQSSLYLPSEQ